MPKRSPEVLRTMRLHATVGIVIFILSLIAIVAAAMMDAVFMFCAGIIGASVGAGATGFTLYRLWLDKTKK